MKQVLITGNEYKLTQRFQQIYQFIKDLKILSYC